MSRRLKTAAAGGRLKTELAVFFRWNVARMVFDGVAPYETVENGDDVARISIDVVNVATGVEVEKPKGCPLPLSELDFMIPITTLP